MRQRFRRRAGTRHHSHGAPGANPGRLRRIIRTLFWSGAAILILLAVLGYDRREVKQATELVERGRSLAAAGEYDDAVMAYQRAFDNPRLSRKKKAEIALAMGDIEYEKFHNPRAALNHYRQARRLAPAIVEPPAIKQRLKDAESLAAESPRRGSSEPGQTSGTVVREVELLNPPEDYREGPVVARFRGGEVRAGAIARAVRDLPAEVERALQNDSGRMADFVRKYLNRELLYRAGLDAGLHRDPAIQSRLFDYQRMLIAERYAADLRQRAHLVPNATVEQYYADNRARYDHPARLGLAMIKTATEDNARQAREELRAGAAFGDVATSRSIDAESARAQGVVGQIIDDATSIPGVGEAPELVKSLFRLQRGQVTSPTQINDAWFIFQVLSNTPRRITTLEEARPEIERTLRASRRDNITRELPEELFTRYEAAVEPEGIEALMRYVLKDGETTATAAAQSSAISPDLGQEKP